MLLLGREACPHASERRSECRGGLRADLPTFLTEKITVWYYSKPGKAFESPYLKSEYDSGVVSIEKGNRYQFWTCINSRRKMVKLSSAFGIILFEGNMLYLKV